MPVYLGLQTEEGYPHAGTLDYAAPSVDAAIVKRQTEITTILRDYGVPLLNEQGELRRHVNIFIDGENARFMGGLSAQVGSDSSLAQLGFHLIELLDLA